MRIKIIEVGQVSKVKTYFELELKYESDGKVQTKKIFSFNGDSYKTLKDAAAGQVYDIKLAKDKNGYWQWESVTLTTATEASGTGPARSNFETPDERARRQVLIVRQSCLQRAVEYCRVEPTIEDVLKIAEEFEDWVMRD